MVIMIFLEIHGNLFAETDFGHMVRSTLLPNRLRGATLENRGVLHSVWPGPLWTDFSPIKRTFQKSFGLGTAMIFDDLSHGVHDFSVEGPER